MEYFGSVAEMAAAADVVALARPSVVVGLSPADESGRKDPSGPAISAVSDTTPEYGTKTIRFSEERLLRSDRPTTEHVDLGFFVSLSTAGDVAPVGDRALLFLRRRQDNGELRLVCSQGAIVDRDGTPSLEFVSPLDLAADPVRRSLDGLSFNEVVDAAERAADS